MRTTDGMSLTGYADLVRRVVAWIAAQERSVSYAAIARRYRLTLDEVEDVVGDSGAYGPQIMATGCQCGRGHTTVEVVG